MVADWQTPAAVLAVALAGGGLLLAAWRKRRRPGTGCGGECACPSKKIRR